MRDPDGRIAFYDNFVIRYLNEPAGPDHFLHSSLAHRWVQKGLLIPYEWIDSNTIKSPRLPFITLPTEWTSIQFFSAARLTLELQREAVELGWDLKDASAWNIVFDGLRPIFVDLLSFIPMRHKPWLAAGQFSRHFLLPLLLYKHKGIEPQHCLQLWRDGVPAKSARELLGLKRFFTRYWPLMAAGYARAEVYEKIKSLNSENFEYIRKFRLRIHVSLEWMLDGLDSIDKYRENTIWGDYENDRLHYSEAEIIFKKSTIRRWIEELNPKWVIDLGCNAGEFAELAVVGGSKVICWDADSQALESLCIRQQNGKAPSFYYPILGPIDDLAGGRGWMGCEFPSLVERLHKRADVVLLLAITHHLVISGGVRLEDVFRFIAKICKKTLLLELLSEKDPRVIQLSFQYNRDPDCFTIEKQLSAASASGFRLVHHVKLNPEDTREYVRLDLKN